MEININVLQRLIGHAYCQTKNFTGTCIPIPASPKRNFKCKLRIESGSNSLDPDYPGHVLALDNPCQPLRSILTAALPFSHPVPSPIHALPRYSTISTSTSTKPFTQKCAHRPTKDRLLSRSHIVQLHDDPSAVSTLRINNPTSPPHRQRSAPRNPLTTMN